MRNAMENIAFASVCIGVFQIVSMWLSVPMTVGGAITSISLGASMLAVSLAIGDDHAAH